MALVPPATTTTPFPVATGQGGCASHPDLPSQCHCWTPEPDIAQNSKAEVGGAARPVIPSHLGAGIAPVTFETDGDMSKAQTPLGELTSPQISQQPHSEGIPYLIS